MKTFHRICETIAVVAIINFLLFVFSVLILGGDGANGKVEGGHYFLGNHGAYREVHPIFFWVSYYHAYSLFITHPLLILSGVFYALTGGERYSTALTSYLVPRSKNKIWQSVLRIQWKVVDFIEEIFWTCLDRWRTPQEEWFVRLSRKECVQRLRRLNSYYLSTGLLEKPIVGIFSGNHFSLEKPNNNPFVRDGGIHPIVKGRFTRTPKGTYVRIWHRYTTIGTLFITLWAGTILSILALLGLAQTDFFHTLGDNAFSAVILFLLVLLFCYTSLFLLSLLVGAQSGQNSNEDIVECIQSVLEEAGIEKM